SLAIGSTAPPFELPLLSGQKACLAGLRELGKLVLLIFSEPRCKPCKALLPDIARWNRDYASKLTIALITRGSAADNTANLSPLGLTHALLQKDREVSDQ